MATVGNIVTFLRMESKGFNKGARNAKQSSRELSGNLGNLTGIANKAGAAIAALAAAAVVGKGFQESAKSARVFNRELNDSTAIQNVNTEQLARMRAEAMRLARSDDIKDFAPQLAGGFEFLALAGKDVEKQIASLERVAKFATAGNFDLATATDLATDAQSAMGLQVVRQR